LLAKLKKGPEYQNFMALEAPNATTTATEATYCGSEAAYPIAASFLDTAILSLTMPVLKEGYTRKSTGGTPPPPHPNTHTHARVGSTRTHTHIETCSCASTTCMFVTGAPVTAETKFPELTLFQPGGLRGTHLSLKGVHEILQSDCPDPVIVVVHSGGPKGTTHTAQVVLLSPHHMYLS